MKGLRRISGVVRGDSVRVVLSGGAAAAETFTATGTVKTAGGATATAPITVTVDRTMPQAEVDGLIAAFKAGGRRSAAQGAGGVAPTGSITLAGGAPTPDAARHRAHPRTRDGSSPIVTDTPILHSAPVCRVRSQRRATTSPSWISKSRPEAAGRARSRRPRGSG